MKMRKKHTVALVIGFCGMGFGGLNTNPLKTGVEDYLMDALYYSGRISHRNMGTGSKFNLNRCSRTDKGVSACSAVLSAKLLDYESDFDPMYHNPTAIIELNGFLPKSIRVFSYVRVSNAFNARTSTSWRDYRYLLPVNCFLEYGIHLDLLVLNHYLRLFEGNKNMRSFTAGVKDDGEFSSNHFTRSIQQCCGEYQVIDGAGYVCITIRGQSFMYHQIRKMIGASIAASIGVWNEKHFLDSFRGFVRNVPLAPASPLLLHSVGLRWDKGYALDVAQKQVSDAKLNSSSLNHPYLLQRKDQSKYKDVILLSQSERFQCEKFYHSDILPNMIQYIERDEDEFSTFFQSLGYS